MIIDFCLLASDLNENYYGLYPYIKKAWSKLGIPTKLILISSFIPDILEKYNDDIILFKPINNMHTAFQAQTIRALYPCIFENKNIIISDMDIIPLNKTYFIDNIINIPNDKFIVFRDAYINDQMYAACYHLANSNLWKKVFSINTVEDIKNKLLKWYDTDYSGQKNCKGWFTDQKMLFKYLNKYANTDLLILEDNNMKFNRLDKRKKKFILDNLDLVYDNIKNNVYSDFHIIRPYTKYIPIINKIIDLINV